MRNLIFIFLYLFFIVPIQAQFKCLSGDCNNGLGKGTYIISGQEIGLFEGSFKDGNFEKGKLIFAKGGSYEGEWKNNIVEGYGIRQMADGTIQAGRWEKGRLSEPMTAQKVLSLLQTRSAAANKETINCEQGDCKNGYGKSVDNKGNRYAGDFKEGMYSGYGEMRFANRDFYKGLWKEGKFSGKGSMFMSNGHTRTGEWIAGQFSENPMEIFALVVGIADYNHYQKLSYTTTDAKEFYKHLRSASGGFIPKENVELLINEEATSLNVKNKMADLFLMADSNDLIIFYFAGHGLDGAFLPVDYDGSGNIVDHVSVINAMNDSDAKFKLILADACHSGSLGVKYEEFKNNGNQFPLASVRSGKSIREQAKDFYKSFANTKKGLAIITSSAPDEISLEANKLKQGVFSYFVIEALKGAADINKDYIITAQELFDHVSKKVDKFTYGFQTPNFIGFSEDAGGYGNIPVGIYYPQESVMPEGKN